MVSTPVTSGLGVQSIVTGAENGKHAHPSTHWQRARPLSKIIGSTRATKNFAIDSILDSRVDVSLLCCTVHATVAWGRGLFAQ